MILKPLPPLFFFIASLASSKAIVVANYSDATNQRFPDNSSFIADAFDLSGVGRSIENGTWATAIGTNYFLSANHSHPATGNTVTFTQDNMGSPITYTNTVGGGFRLGNTDLWLGYTVADINPSIARYAVANQSANSLAATGLGASTLFMSGDQVAGQAGTVNDHVVGTNQADSFYNEGSGQFLTPGTTVLFTPPPGFENDMIITIENLPGDDSPALFHEAVVEGGDSGSPLFSVSGTTLTIEGTASLLLTGIPGNFIDTPGPDDREVRNGSTYSYIGSYITELDAAIASVPAAIINIPEPSSTALIFLALGFGMRRKR